MPAGSGNEELLIWERPEPPARQAPVPLSRPAIVAAAVAVADADGLGAVTFRKLAAALEAGPMRLYGYLASKDELLDLMVDEVYGEIAADQTGPDGGDWRAVLRSQAHRVRRAALRHEWFAELLAGRPHTGPRALAFLEESYAAFGDDAASDDAVFGDIDAVMAAVGTFNAYVLGAISGEIAERRAERATGMDERQWQAASGPYIMRMLATGRYPALARIVRDATHPGPSVAFGIGLDSVLEGIAARARRPS
jgi:AcrR family transcriptional regulator